VKTWICLRKRELPFAFIAVIVLVYLMIGGGRRSKKFNRRSSISQHIHCSILSSRLCDRDLCHHEETEDWYVPHNSIILALLKDNRIPANFFHRHMALVASFMNIEKDSFTSCSLRISSWAIISVLVIYWRKFIDFKSTVFIWSSWLPLFLLSSLIAY